MCTCTCACTRVHMPQVHLMDLEPHRAWLDLSDPQAKTSYLPPRDGTYGSVFLEAQYVAW